MVVNENQQDSENEAWLSITDIMSGLSVFFIFVNAGLFWLVINPGLERIQTFGDCGVEFNYLPQAVQILPTLGQPMSVSQGGAGCHGSVLDRMDLPYELAPRARRDIPTVEIAIDKHIQFDKEKYSIDEMDENDSDHELQIKEIERVCNRWIKYYSNKLIDEDTGELIARDPNLVLVIHGYASCAPGSKNNNNNNNNKNNNDGKLPYTWANFNAAFDRAHSIYRRCIRLFCELEKKGEMKKVGETTRPKAEVEECTPTGEDTSGHDWQAFAWDFGSTMVLSLDGESVHALRQGNCSRKESEHDKNYQSITFSLQYIEGRSGYFEEMEGVRQNAQLPP